MPSLTNDADVVPASIEDKPEQALIFPALTEDEHKPATVTAVIPTLNEAANLPHVFDRLPRDVDEIIIVDGRSSDDTPAVARALDPCVPREFRECVKILCEQRPGKGYALRTGFEAAMCDIIVMLDADGSTDPAEIPRFVQSLVHGADFAKGSRFAVGAGSADITPIRRLGNWGLNALVNLLFRTRYTDLCYGYNAFWRRCLPMIDIDAAGFEVETMMNIRVARAGLRVIEVPSRERERIHGESKLNAGRDGLRVLSTIMRERFRR